MSLLKESRLNTDTSARLFCQLCAWRELDVGDSLVMVIGNGEEGEE